MSFHVVKFASELQLRESRKVEMAIQSVSRAIELTVLVARGETNGSGKELALAAGLPVPTAHHILSTLVEKGILERTPENGYGLGPTVGMLAEIFQNQAAPPEFLAAPLRQLASVTGDTTYLAAWRNGNIRILLSVLGKATVKVSVPSDPYEDAHARATGKVLLAFANEGTRQSYLRGRSLVARTSKTITDIVVLNDELRMVRELGYATEIEEFHPGVACVSAPVLFDDHLIAAYSLSAPVERFIQNRAELIDAVRSVAASARDGFRRLTEMPQDPKSSLISAGYARTDARPTEKEG